MGRVFQVVGYQNSGKTSFVVDYIKAAVKQNLKVGTIKHHGHAQALEFKDQDKDTGKHRQAGAYVSLVEGNGSFVLTSEKLSLSLQQLISFYNLIDLDIIIIEGFKSALYPKVVLIRSIEDLPILNNVHNIYCIVTNINLPLELTKRYKVFNDSKESIDCLLLNKVGDVIG
ncbi:molybdopterin-guanine dinucleotide biosynthesis protein B [Metabacillus sediminilitoris]|uniref:Molybdopterin-guanine dinucleotide biosynthesis protein B n=1 Tax=Metabacillus sediminilitoris TaxID=2567941 RepID=A0A4S4BYQ6_9BACI|nr:molybdopterin-guanine dinucleotide biosynthesis protein B [Metabacillus sediminilitoris]QGQ47063.1 molybdopterin-guanine dinucleotide biosynthesis protein B [Metabacillus sediminilitoris]THF80408.1 molybdopterin-guanine dinucleotide biosynthesis protein B [Metabacillus sediminilitoris]